MSVNVGDKATDFLLPDQTGKARTVAEFLGSWVLIYFYPKDDTPGCTTEACGLRDAFADSEKAHCQVLGVSADSVARHKKFAEKYHLSFPLLEDENKHLITAFGVWQEKSFSGKK